MFESIEVYNMFWILRPTNQYLFGPNFNLKLLFFISFRRIVQSNNHLQNLLILYFWEFFFQVENLGTSAASEVLLAFSPTEVEHLALLKAAATSGKRKKKTYVPLDVKSAKQPDGPNGTKFFSITLLTPLSKDETTTLEVLYMLTRSLEPFPVEISQSESQLVYFRDSAILLSPYHVKQQTTFLKTPSTRVESFTVVDPTKRAGTELKYGPYENHPPYSYSPVLVHFENNNPFAVVEELEREIEISHWGSIQVTERYSLVHAGAQHKGVFSRYICYLAFLLDASDLHSVLWETYISVKIWKK